MSKSVRAVLFLAPILFIVAISEAQSIILQPQSLSSDLSVNINDTLSSSSCSYTVTIKTSCSSPQYTRDHISLSFGDAYGYQVYAPGLDDPASGTFERCSVDTYEISGSCLYQVCYLYLYRSGYDGWRPESVQVCSYNTGCDTFYYNTLIPNNVWYGFNYCGRSAAAAALASPSTMNKWLPHALQLLFCFRCWKSLLG
ncbi:embryo-specific protein ATS3B-like isoform X2 [Diospyros lotus]|uniref:embryo-specific protein ATS3B-like isoform X2 n=1 Tax=Diospyros lotus TaxID=55363 RepID=UPI00225B254C|nr:embryo-specific protein ATS3B-like isoform X2 [Diospyros lotus]